MADRRRAGASRGGRARRLSARLSAAALALLALASALAAGDDPPRERRAELSRLVVQDCGFCHGLTLRGGLGNPLTPEALRDRPSAVLAAAIIYGRPGTAMPPWRDFISEREAAWIVDELRKGNIRAR